MTAIEFTIASDQASNFKLQRTMVVGGASETGMRLPAAFKRGVFSLPVVLLLSIISTAEAAPS